MTSLTWSLDHVVVPVDYWSRRLSHEPASGDVGACFDAVQQELHALLGAYLLDEYHGAGQLLAPLTAGYPDRFRWRIEVLVPLLAFLDERLGGFGPATAVASEAARGRGGVKPDSLCALLASAYRGLDHSAPGMDVDAGFRTVEAPPPFDPADYPTRDARYVGPLERLQRYGSQHLDEHLLGLFLFASGATMDYVPGWSDHDTLAILRRETVLDPPRLRQARTHLFRSRRFFHPNDPLQHGHFAVTEIDLAYYAESFMPLFMFDYSKTLVAPGRPLRVRPRADEKEAIAFLYHQYVPYADGPLKQFAAGRATPDPVEAKALLHMLFFFPVVYLQARGKHVYKRDVFQRVLEVHPDWDWDPWRRATEIRATWDEVFRPGVLSSAIVRFNPHLGRFLAKRAFRRRGPSALGSRQGWDYLARGLSRWIREGWAIVEGTVRGGQPEASQ